MNFQKSVYFFSWLMYNRDSQGIWLMCKMEAPVFVNCGQVLSHICKGCTKDGVSFLQVTQNVINSLDLCDILSYNNSK